jgi:TatA/E family protein of Tat protein translocase
MMEMKDMFQNIGFTELLLIAVVALVLFGPNKLPEIGRVLGRTIRDFKKGAYELLNDEPSAPSTPASGATPAAVQQAPQASLAATVGSEQTSAPATKAAVAFVSNGPALAEVDASPASMAAAPAAEQPAVKAAVSFVSSAPVLAESDAQPAAPTAAPTAPPAAAPIAPSSTRRLPD